MFKIQRFTYTNRKGETRDAILLVLKEEDNYVAGVDITRLDEETKESFVQFIVEFSQFLDYVIHESYRKFLVDRIEDLEDLRPIDLVDFVNTEVL